MLPLHLVNGSARSSAEIADFVVIRVRPRDRADENGHFGHFLERNGSECCGKVAKGWAIPPPGDIEYLKQFILKDR
jgi:hypothetical protein